MRIYGYSGEKNIFLSFSLYIDMPTTGETNSGPVEIITYSDQHETDIYNNGNVIARAFTNMIAIEGTHQMDLDTTVYW